MQLLLSFQPSCCCCCCCKDTCKADLILKAITEQGIVLQELKEIAEKLMPALKPSSSNQLLLNQLPPSFSTSNQPLPNQLPPSPSTSNQPLPNQLPPSSSTFNQPEEDDYFPPLPSPIGMPPSLYYNIPLTSSPSQETLPPSCTFLCHQLCWRHPQKIT